MTFLFLRAIASFLVLAWLGTAGAHAQQPPAYRFSPVNQYGINMTAAYWNPILAHVSQRSGVKLQLKLGRTSADTTSYVLAQEVEFVFTNHLFSPERDGLGWRVFGRRQTPPVRGQIAVPFESPLTDLAQLQGKEIAFPGPEAVISYKVPHAQLMAQQIDVKIVFGGNTDGALAQMFSGRVHAVGVNSQLLENYEKREGKKARVLWSSAPLHDLALMAAEKVPEATLKAVAQAFFGMATDPQGQEVLRQASRLVNLPTDTRFVPSDGSEYGAYRDFYRTAPPLLR
jgi:phosphonate transport system substrate-binding protein